MQFKNLTITFLFLYGRWPSQLMYCHLIIRRNFDLDLNKLITKFPNSLWSTDQAYFAVRCFRVLIELVKLVFEITQSHVYHHCTVQVPQLILMIHSYFLPFLILTICHPFSSRLLCSTYSLSADIVIIKKYHVYMYIESIN